MPQLWMAGAVIPYRCLPLGEPCMTSSRIMSMATWLHKMQRQIGNEEGPCMPFEFYEMVGFGWFERTSCGGLATFTLSKALAFFQRGGLCDPVPGRNAFEFAVQKDRIRPLDQLGSAWSICGKGDTVLNGFNMLQRRLQVDRE